MARNQYSFVGFGTSSFPCACLLGMEDTPTKKEKVGSNMSPLAFEFYKRFHQVISQVVSKEEILESFYLTFEYDGNNRVNIFRYQIQTKIEPRTIGGTICIPDKTTSPVGPNLSEEYLEIYGENLKLDLENFRKKITTISKIPTATFHHGAQL